ncbi:MAG: TIGR03943 family protein [Ruminococcaceae bacterium]|nr:TIGR03943 family protein [Oscillospiraceae bacterium]
MMKKINGEVLLQMILIAVIDAFLVGLLVTGKVKNYIHPRLILYLWFAVGALAVIALLMIPVMLQPRHKVSLFPYLIFVFPLLTGFILPPTTDMAQVAGIGTGKAISSPGLSEQAPQNLQDTVSQLTFPEQEASQSSSSAPESGESAEKVDVPDGVTLITDDEYLDWYMDVYENPEKYEGKQYKIKGTVFRMDGFADNEFVPARMAMVCCAADLAAAGFLCRADDAKKWNDGDWIWVTATIKVEFEKNMGETMPILYPSSIEPAEKPKEEWVYPTY